VQELNDEDDREDEEAEDSRPEMDEASGHRQEVLDDDQQIRFTPGMLREMMTDIVGSVLDRASPPKSRAGSKSPSKRSKGLEDERALDKKWQRSAFCVSDNVCAINLSKQLRIK
jgi:hypothetical protein